MSASEKIFDLNSLTPVLEAERARSKKVVHCHGVFDLLHIGHIRHLHQAKKLGDVLVVTLTSDQFVNKGPHRPAFNQQLRAEALASLECVDYVAINDSASAEQAIRAVVPNYYVKGKDYRDRPETPDSKLKKEETAIIELGGELVFTDDVMYSSSNLINQHLSQFPPEVGAYLRKLRERCSPEMVTQLFDAMQDLKVLIVGETIIDEYHYCEAIGKAGKEPVLVARFKNSEQFVGGNLAIANNLSAFCKNIGLLSFLGDTEPREDFIRAHLKENVRPQFLYHKGRPTIVKLRYVESYLLQKLFEVYTMDDNTMPAEEEERLCAALEQEVPKYDLVIVADYGHGMLTSRAKKILCEKAKFLAVNTQANAGNRGFHTISSYPRADYVSISETELRLEMRERDGDAKEMLDRLIKRMDCPYITITRGRTGMMTYRKDAGIAEAPALAQEVVDRVGSGDAVLALTAPLAALGVPPEVLVFIGNVAGAEAVKIVGHRSFLERKPLIRHISSLLK